MRRVQAHVHGRAHRPEKMTVELRNVLVNTLGPFWEFMACSSRAFTLVTAQCAAILQIDLLKIEHVFCR